MTPAAGPTDRLEKFTTAAVRARSAEADLVLLHTMLTWATTHRTASKQAFTAHVRARGEEAQAIKHDAGYRARRSVVERTHSWMNRFRALLVWWEKITANYFASLHVACAYITVKRAGRRG